MPDFKFLDQTNSHNSFQIAWESTLKCNFDCSYCGDGHDNSVEHPSLEDSIKTVDFIVEYVNLYMMTRPPHVRFANLNIQGGESIFHPNIIEILEYVRTKKNLYSDWNLNVALITNGTTGVERWKRISELVDYFTLSYHPESLPKQQELLKLNILHLKKTQKNFKVSVLMHPKLWDQCIDFINWCKENNIDHNLRQIDHTWTEFRFNYTADQTEYLTGSKQVPLSTKVISFFKNGINLSSQGRACCGGEILCTDKDQSLSYIKGNNFSGWHCSVNKFFLYVRQVTGEIYTNKDCKMNLQGNVGVIGNLKQSESVLIDLKKQIETDTLPDIICKKHSCWCGLCAPKATSKEDYIRIMEKYTC